jgi:hypothetical protein
LSLEKNPPPPQISRIIGMHTGESRVETKNSLPTFFCRKERKRGEFLQTLLARPSSSIDWDNKPHHGSSRLLIVLVSFHVVVLLLLGLFESIVLWSVRTIPKYSTAFASVKNPLLRRCKAFFGGCQDLFLSQFALKHSRSSPTMCSQAGVAACVCGCTPRLTK